MINELTLRLEVPNTPANQKKERLSRKKKREDLEIATESQERDRETITSSDRREKIKENKDRT